MSQILERAVRRFVAVGSGLSRRDYRTLGDFPPEIGDPMGLPPSNEFVIPGNSPASRPKGVYASLLLRRDQRVGYPVFRQLSDGGGTANLVYRRATYSLQFYRRGAADYAQRFDLFAMSENGLSYAETAFSDGRIARMRMYSGGSGYDTPPRVEFISREGDGARAEASLVRGAVANVTLLSRGERYTEPPEIRFVGGGGSGAAAVPRGYGFRVRQPLEIRRVDAPEADEFEERAVIDLSVDYAVWFEQDTGLIDSVDCTVIMGDMRDTGRIQIGA